MTQPATLIAIDPEAVERLLEPLRAEVRDLRRALEAATVQPLPEWMPINDYAKYVGKDRNTVRRWVREGKIDSDRTGSVTLVKRA